ncbi:MAG: histidine kinase [Saprospiraceae bacterium]|nr:histidine kinase [Saprospiraceae bacterium]
MKKQLPKVLLWTLIFYYIYGPLQSAAIKGDIRELYAFLTNRDVCLLVVTTFAVFSFFSIGCYLVFYHLFVRKGLVFSLLGCLGVVLIGIGLRYFLQEIAMRWIFGFGNYKEGYSFKSYIIDNLYYAFIFSGFGTVLFFFWYAQFRGERERQLENENQKMQLSLLRSQINPHFLFNALNSIYALVNENSRFALPAIETLSKALRYSLYEQADKVPLSKEWGFIEDYIHLQEMRLPYSPALLIDIPEPLPEIEIAPFILINFVENAFKHGQLDDVKSPVRITMKMTQDAFFFCISNKIKKQVKDTTGGIGLANTQKRLALIYGNQHNVTIDTTPTNHYSVSLKINLDACSIA